MTDKENKWIKFYPSLELPKERVSIAYDTHDERGYRFAYGYFQFYNGTCGCFWKDGNEQSKVVKAEDIKYWMPVPSLDVQEEPVNEDFKQEINAEWNCYSKDGQVACINRFSFELIARHFANLQKEHLMAKAVDGVLSSTITGSEQVISAYVGYGELGKNGDKVKIIIFKEE